MTGPRSQDVSAFPGAPGVPGGGDSGPSVPMNSGVVGNNDFLEGGAESVPLTDAFPGYTGDTWQKQAMTPPPVKESTQSDPGHVSGGIRTESPPAFYPGLGQGV